MKRINVKKELMEWVQSIVVAFVIVLPIIFFARPTLVEGISMEPTLFNNNVVVTQMNVKHLQRGEVVVFDAKPVEDENYIKRVIGLPGDIVEIKVGHVYVNGIEIKEPYLSKDTVTEPEMMVKVPENEIFVLGDNREESQDSRFIGTIPFEKIRGRAYFRIFPLNKMGKF